MWVINNFSVSIVQFSITFLTKFESFDNRVLNCGFQPGKSLYTTVRELVENALDSAESISELPEVEVTMYVP